MGENTAYDDYLAATTPANPLTVLTFYDPDVLADDICHLWRSGSRHPLLVRQLLNVWPGLPLDVYNQSASIAWDRLRPEEREAADHVE